MQKGCLSVTAFRFYFWCFFSNPSPVCLSNCQHLIQILDKFPGKMQKLQFAINYEDTGVITHYIIHFDDSGAV